VQEPAGDVIVGTTGRNTVASQLDITDFSIAVLRANN
jgi:hypothetical protein